VFSRAWWVYEVTKWTWRDFRKWSAKSGEFRKWRLLQRNRNISRKIQLCYLRRNTPSKSSHERLLLASVLEARGFILIRDTDLSSLIFVVILLNIRNKIKTSAQNRPRPVSSSSFPIHKSSYITCSSAGGEKLFSLGKSGASLKKDFYVYTVEIFIVAPCIL